MSTSTIITTPTYEAWPALNYEEFKSTNHLLHMCTQAMGKCKLVTPFEPHWANVAMWLTSTGITTGVIPYGLASFTIDMNLIEHRIDCTTAWGKKASLNLETTSVAQLIQTLFDKLHAIGINITINPKPQEVPNPIPFHEDTKVYEYQPELANAWFRALKSSYIVLKRYHARFRGITPPIGLMWGTFDLRDARYTNIQVKLSKENEGYLRRNAMDVMQVEAGWWSGYEAYPQAAYYSFIYPQPPGIEQSKNIKPDRAHWNAKQGEFILNYEDVRKAKNPEYDLLSFFETTYNAGAEATGWEKKINRPWYPDLIAAPFETVALRQAQDDLLRANGKINFRPLALRRLQSSRLEGRGG